MQTQAITTLKLNKRTATRVQGPRLVQDGHSRQIEGIAYVPQLSVRHLQMRMDGKTARLVYCPQNRYSQQASEQRKAQIWARIQEIKEELRNVPLSRKTVNGKVYRQGYLKAVEAIQAMAMSEKLVTAILTGTKQRTSLKSIREYQQ